MRASLVLLVLGCHDPIATTGASPRPIAKAADDAPAPPCPTAPVNLHAGLVAERVSLSGTIAGKEAPCIDVVRADLTRFRLRVLTSARDGGSHPAPVWRNTFKLAAVINAGMFHESGVPVGMIVEDGTVVAGDNKKYSGFLAFDARDGSPPVIAGRDCPGFDLADLRKRYRSIVQSSRLLGCRGEALPWQDKKQYSAAVIGLDRKGHVVMLHARAAVTMTELAQSIAALDLAGALFLEGGPEASLVVRGSEGELSRVGSYETGFVENDSNQSFWWLPNVIALEAR